MILISDLEKELSDMITVSPSVTNIKEFCSVYCGREKLIDVYNQYCNRPFKEQQKDITKQYFYIVIDSLFTTYFIGNTKYVDFDQPVI